MLIFIFLRGFMSLNAPTLTERVMNYLSNEATVQNLTDFIQRDGKNSYVLLHSNFQTSELLHRCENRIISDHELETFWNDKSIIKLNMLCPTIVQNWANSIEENCQNEGIKKCNCVLQFDVLNLRNNHPNVVAFTVII